MIAKPLLSGQPATASGDTGSMALLEVIQTLVTLTNRQAAELDALKQRLTAAGIP